MKRPIYPFSAIVGQQEMKLALLLAAVDWRLGVLLRGDKGSGKTTAARGLAALLPAPAPFINLPLGATEDRLIGGLHLERAIQGDPVLKPGLLSEAHGGVLYIDEVNLLPPHLGDALLDAAATGMHVVEREGLSASHPAEFVLLGSMNPEEGSLRPQLLDRFALAATIGAPLDPTERVAIMERRMAFDRDPERFHQSWADEENHLRQQIATARVSLPHIACSPQMLAHISTLVCAHHIRSLRADLALLRAAIAYAALQGEPSVTPAHIDAVQSLALAHRTRDPRPPSPPPPPQQQPQPEASPSDEPRQDATRAPERVFAPRAVEAPALELHHADVTRSGSAPASTKARGPVMRSQPSAAPRELDLRATLTHALRETGSPTPRLADLHERVRAPIAATRFLLLIDSSGSHAVRERMRLVKGAALQLLTRSFQRGDEVTLLVFRGTSAEVILEPSPQLDDAAAALEYLPTGGRTPLAHGLALARSYVTPNTLLLLITDGRANFPLHSEDPWQDALTAAAELTCPALVVATDIVATDIDATDIDATDIDATDIHTETAQHRTGPHTRQARALAAALHARCVALDQLAAIADLKLDLAPRHSA